MTEALVTGKAYLERGEPVVVLLRWADKGPRNVLIQRSDGTKVVRPFRGLRVPSLNGGSTKSTQPQTIDNGGSKGGA